MITDLDLHFARRMRRRRMLIGMTQSTLGRQLGVRPQQVQKWETGANRISASRLWGIACALGVPTAYFFDGLAAPSAPPVQHLMEA